MSLEQDMLCGNIGFQIKSMDFPEAIIYLLDVILRLTSTVMLSDAGT